MGAINGPAETRFWKKVSTQPNGCWAWLGGTDENGYGKFSPKHAKTVLAHRFAYQLYQAEIPNGMVLDHLCRTPSCVNPNHLEPVTNRENVRRGLSGTLRTHCKRGHSQTPENVSVRRSQTVCMPCNREMAKKRVARQKGASK